MSKSNTWRYIILLLLILYVLARFGLLPIPGYNIYETRAQESSQSNTTSQDSTSSKSHGNGTYSYRDKSGTTGYIDKDGYGHYKNPDGSTEVTDGRGHVGKDTDGDGVIDKYSPDSGETWIDTNSKSK